jgi:hypothetical protein
MDTNRLERLREAMRARAETIRSQRADATEVLHHAEGIIATARETRAIAATALARIRIQRGGVGRGPPPANDIGCMAWRLVPLGFLESGILFAS